MVVGRSVNLICLFPSLCHGTSCENSGFWVVAATVHMQSTVVRLSALAPSSGHPFNSVDFGCCRSAWCHRFHFGAMFYPNCDSRMGRAAWQHPHPHYRGHPHSTASFDQEYLAAAAAGKVSSTMQRAMAAAAAAHQWQQQNAKDPCFDSFGRRSTTLFLHCAFSRKSWAQPWCKCFVMEFAR